MKKDYQKQRETWVLESLQREGFSNVRFGPDPPDLLLNDTIAIEVSTLTQYVEENGKLVSVKNASNSFKGLVDKILNEFPNTARSNSVVISYTFYRPLPDAKIVSRILRKLLNNHLPFMHQKTKYEFDKMEFRFEPCETDFDNRYVIFGMVDSEKGGWGFSISAESLQVILKEKELILQGYGKLYQENWLALIDETALSINDQYLAEVRNYMQLTSTFDKILLFSPFHHFKFNTLYSKPGT